MNITWLIIMIAIFLIPASCFVFGLITAIKYVIKDDTKNYEKFAWISTFRINWMLNYHLLHNFKLTKIIFILF